MTDVAVVVVPGLGGSGTGHWQSLWQSVHPDWVRTAPASWDLPDPEDWDAALGDAVASTGSAPVLLAHSLGCLSALAFAARRPDAVSGVFLVAPPDPDAPSFPAEVRRFSAMTAGLRSLSLPLVAVTSSTDPYCSADRAAALCRQWGATQLDIGDAGHINVPSGHGPWPEGYALFSGYLHERGRDSTGA